MNLTSQQERAVATNSQKIAVIAGPGSGKTRVLIERIKRLIADGVRPEEIVCVTFTNAAANEIVKRLKCEQCGGSGAYPVEPDGEPEQCRCDGQPIQLGYCGTFHGFVLRMIQRHGALIGFKGRIAMLDEDQQAALLKQVMSDLKIKATLTAVREELARGPGKFYGASGRTFGDLELIAAEYYQRLMSASLLDFDSLLQFGNLLIARINALTDESNFFAGFRFLFWDEFQDSGDADAEAFHTIPIANKFAVGDVDQSIYGFRGARPDHLLALAKSGSFEVIILELNFRCDPAITEAANNLIRNNPGRIEKQTVSATGGEGKIWTFRGATEAEELRGVAEDIRLQPDPKECAVLLRSNALVERFAKGLESFGIAVKRREKTERPPDWKTARSLVNLLANPNNDLLAFWWIESQKDNRFAKKVKLDALNAFTSINRSFLHLPEAITVEGIPAALAKSGIGVEAVARISAAITTLPAGATLAELSFALGDDELHRADTGEGVVVSTMHGAKGLEWDNVYLPAFEDGTIPKLTKNSTIDEERRVAFVAITRARHRLCVSYAEKRKPEFGGFIPEARKISRFAVECR